jgi:hypothetical protein
MTPLNKKYKFLLIFLVPLFLAACFRIPMSNLDGRNFGSIFGHEFVMQSPLYLFEVKEYEAPYPEPVYYILVRSNLIGGPELKELGEVKAGSRIKVVGVVKLGWPVNSIEYEVEVIGEVDPIFAGKKMRLDGRRADNYKRPTPPLDYPLLNEKYFKKI